jgi:hypothetical protein
MAGKLNAELGPTLKQKPAPASDCENEWYYLNRSRQVGPFSQIELHMLLAKEVIFSSTLVRTHDGSGWRPLRELSNEPARPDSPRSNWKFVALFITPFVVGIIATAPKDVEKKYFLTTETIKTKTNGNELLEKAKDYDREPMIEASVPGNYRKPRTSISSLDRSMSIFNAVRPALPHKVSLSPERQSELEFWRSIAHSSDTDLYRAYLRRYPTGPFHDTANSEIRPSKPEASVVSPTRPTAAKRRNSGSTSRKVDAKRSKRKTAKTSGRCWTGNIASCKER